MLFRNATRVLLHKAGAGGGRPRVTKSSGGAIPEEPGADFKQPPGYTAKRAPRMRVDKGEKWDSFTDGTAAGDLYRSVSQRQKGRVAQKEMSAADEAKMVRLLAASVALTGFILVASHTASRPAVCVMMALYFPVLTAVAATLQWPNLHLCSLPIMAFVLLAFVSVHLQSSVSWPVCAQFAATAAFFSYPFFSA